jgi:hypothetical protein
MWDAAGVAPDDSMTAYRRSNFTRCLRKRTKSVPVNRKSKQQDQNRYAHINDAYDAAEQYPILHF